MTVPSTTCAGSPASSTPRTSRARGPVRRSSARSSTPWRTSPTRRSAPHALHLLHGSWPAPTPPRPSLTAAGRCCGPTADAATTAPVRPAVAVPATVALRAAVTHPDGPAATRPEEPVRGGRRGGARRAPAVRAPRPRGRRSRQRPQPARPAGPHHVGGPDHDDRGPDHHAVEPVGRHHRGSDHRAHRWPDRVHRRRPGHQHQLPMGAVGQRAARPEALGVRTA